MLTKDRDKKIDAAIRRLQRERLEFEETSKAEAEEESHRLEQVGAATKTGLPGGGGVIWRGVTSFFRRLAILF